MPSYNVALVVGVPQTLPPCQHFRSLQNQGAGVVCVTEWWTGCATVSGVGQYMKKDSTGAVPPTGDGGIWDTKGSDWLGSLRLECFGANCVVCVADF